MLRACGVAGCSTARSTRFKVRAPCSLLYIEGAVDAGHFTEWQQSGAPDRLLSYLLRLAALSSNCTRHNALISLIFIESNVMHFVLVKTRFDLQS
jgi:hypothetical protein